MTMKIAIAADHRGGATLAQLISMLEQRGYELIRVPSCEDKTCDYPDMAYPVATAVAEGRADRGVLVCGSGIGMCIAANKVKGVRAALVHDEIGAEMSRRHNDANVICLAADLLGVKLIERIVDVWLSTAFEAGRHARRVAKITAIEEGRDPRNPADPQNSTQVAMESLNEV